MKIKDTFKRYELKYLITTEQKEKILEAAQGKISGDEFGKSTIYNIYYDTPSHLMIRRSLEKPIYKEKIRVRSYGPAEADSKVFVELKKKYESVVYKRRVSMKYDEACEYLTGDGSRINKRRPKMKYLEGQILNELDYCVDHYDNLAPAVFLSYDREAFFANEGLELRMTFDENIMWRDYDITLEGKPYGEKILDDGMVLMELKTPFAIPYWLVRTMSELGIKQTSFSKYGNAYKVISSR